MLLHAFLSTFADYSIFSSLDSISKNFGPVRVDVLGKIAEAVLGGLTYLYQVHRIMHRDIKPSNVLLNSKGHIKLCDFGVSSELENSVADTFVGTGTYMAPERIQGSPYTVKSDVWSVGLTIMELAIGKFPFAPDSESADDDEDGGPQGILDLLQQIVLEPSPRLPKSDAFPQILEDMITKCLLKDPKQRPTPQELYVSTSPLMTYREKSNTEQESDDFLLAAKRTPVDLEAWAVSMMERHNRRSHLAPQLSPATKQALKDPSSVSAPPSVNAPSPISTDIPIGSLSLGPNGRNSPQVADARPSPLRTTSASNINGASQMRSPLNSLADKRRPQSGAGHQNPGLTRMNGHAPAPEVIVREARRQGTISPSSYATENGQRF